MTQRKPRFKIEKVGLQTTFQDLGRFGYQQYGVPVSGAMDRFSLQLGNLLVGNSRSEAGMEMTMVGPELVAKSASVVALCGADLRPEVNGKSAPMWKSFRLQEGDRLAFGTPRSGLRSYLTVAGGFDIPLVMGSKSNYERSGLGRAIHKGDVIYGFEATGQAGVGLTPDRIPQFEKEIEVRVVEGPHTDYFTEEAVSTFFSGTHTVSPQSDRMGYRLESVEVKQRGKTDIWTDAIPFGGIQIPSGGKPIILMADRQTTGGYPRIGTVISVDLPKVAQLAPGGKIRFRAVDVDEAETLCKDREQFFKLAGAGRGSNDFT